MRLITLVLFMLAIFLINAHAIRVGEEERRIWAPLVLGLLAVVTMVRVPMLLRTSQRLLLSPPFVLFVIYLLWLGLTQFWSLAPVEGRNHIVVLWMALIAVLALSAEPAYRTAAVFVLAVAVVLLWSWAGVAIDADWVTLDRAHWRLKGVLMHPQTMTQVTAAGLLVALIWHLNRRTCELRGYRGWIGALFLLGLATLVAAKGRSLSAFLVLTLFIVFFYHIKGPARVWVLAAGILLGGGLYVAIDVIMPLISRGQEETLSGRLIVWELTLREIADRPFRGYGFATYLDYFFNLYNNWAPAHAHNLWLQVTFESGLIGAVLYTLFLGALMFQGWRFQRDTGLVSYSFCLGFYCLLGGSTAVFMGEKLSTLYGLLLLFTFQEERLRHDALAQAKSDAPAGELQPA